MPPDRGHTWADRWATAATAGAGAVGARRGGLGPFVTFIEVERPDGLVARYESRRQRKHARRGIVAGRHLVGTHRPGDGGSASSSLLGSALFALGALPGYAGAVGTRSDSITFFVGSVFFTSAAFLQYRESVDAGGRDGP